MTISGGWTISDCRDHARYYSIPEYSSIPNLSYTVSSNIIVILFYADSHIDSIVSEIDRGKICQRSVPSSVVHTVIIQDTSQK